MSNTDQTDLFGGQPAAIPEQFRLTRFAVLNWGTFSDLVEIDVSPKGFLFVGPSGAGKSTLLDANSTLMTPPRWRGFNQAANEGHGKDQDRDVMTYVRGAWGQQTGKNGEAVQQFLREGTTWSALAQTYTCTTGKQVSIAQVYWVRGRTTDRKEIKRTFLVADRAFDLRELQPFADADFDLKVLRAVPGVTVHDEFSGYMDRFRRMVGIEQESAFRLLHKTQSAKNLGDLNDFLRDFALDPPETFELANKLVGHFQALREAHASVVDTRRQIEVLVPAREAFERLGLERATLAQLAQTKLDLDAFREQQKSVLIQDMITQARRDITEKSEQAAELRQQEEDARTSLNILLGKRNGAGSAQIQQCEAALSAARSKLNTVESNQAILDAVAEAVVTATPYTEDGFLDLRDAARKYIEDTQRREAEIRSERDKLTLERHTTNVELRAVQAEIAALARRRSNMPAKLLEVRTRLCEALGLAESALPFAGELVDVRKDQHEWKPAAERVMHNFATHLVVSEDDFRAVSRYINDNHMGAAVLYFRAKPIEMQARALPPASLCRKLEFTDHELASWVAAKARTQFDMECVDSLEQLDFVRRGVTKEGQVKTDDVSYRKDDRRNINDRSTWILGGDNQAKLDSCLERAQDLTDKLAGLNQKIEAMDAQSSANTALRQCEKLREMSWDDFDLERAQRMFDVAEGQLETAKEAMPDIDELDAKIAEQESKHRHAQKAASALEAQCEAMLRDIGVFESRLQLLSPALLAIELSEETQAAILARYTAPLTLENIDRATSDVKDVVAKEERTAQARASAQQNAMLNQFRDYVRDWPLKAANLDATEASAPEFMEILANLEKDGLPSHEERFLQMLREQGTQELMRLSALLHAEHKAIKNRLSDVNDSLRTAAFNPGTHLVIEAKDKQLPDVMAFRQALREAATDYMADSSAQEAERRFNLINELVTKLESQEIAAKRWRELCLDVRAQVDFVIREVDAEGREVEVYRSGAGKSGGQRQKLTATILAAALRYQLGGKETGLPKFSTVFMDEAFDKADAEFTDLAMNIFKTFGFQLVVATPLKSVMTLEPYIGGACFVHIQERKHSRIVPVRYLDGDNKLDFKAAGVPDVDAE